MPKIEVISSDEEDDIWDYRSQTQKARNQNDLDSKKSTVSELRRKSESSKNSGRSRYSLTQKKVKTEDGGFVTVNKSQKQKKATGKRKTKVKVEVKPECTPNAKQNVDRSGRCPVCQMPFLLLSMVETPSWHVDQCLDVPYSSKNECPKGLDCDSEFPNHYKKFRHQVIARSRRKNEVTNEKGNVEGAKTKLSFDGAADDTKLVLPGSSSDCIIILDSSQDSNFSQRSNHDVEDEDFPSPREDKTEKKLMSIDEDKVYTSKSCGTFGNTKSGEGSQSKKLKGKGFDQNKNFLQNDAHQELENDLFGTNSEDEEQVIEIDFENDNAELEEMGTHVGIVNVSDDSCGSVQDIDALVDETRSVSDMIHDALAADDASVSNSSEIYHDNVDSLKAYESTRTNVYGNEFDAENDTALDREQTNNDDEEDDLISLFTDKDKRNTSVKSSKESTISGLKKTPKDFQDSDSSSDWEILKTTLTQPLFDENDYKDMTDTDKNDYKDMTDTEENDLKDKIDTEVDLVEDTALMYAASIKTPIKTSDKAVTNQHKDKEGIDGNHIEESKVQKKGFFATKMLQNANKNKPNNKCINKLSKRIDDKHSSDDSSLESNQLKEECIRETSTYGRQKMCTVDIDSKNKVKNSHLKRKSTDQLEIDIDSVSQKAPLSAKLRNQNSENLESASACVPETDKKGHLTPNKVETYKTEVIEKKPKIELKPKTPSKRKKGRKDQKDINVSKKKGSKKVYPKLESFFKLEKGCKDVQVSIQTDSESSGDCERFNKIGKFVKCCEKCTEESSCKGNYPRSIGIRNYVSNSGDNNSRLLDTEKVTIRRPSDVSSCSRDKVDNDSDFFSEAASSKDVRDSQNSIKLTISGDCQNSSQTEKDESQHQSNRNKVGCESLSQSKSFSCQNQGQSYSNHSQDKSFSNQSQVQSCYYQSQGQSCSHKNQSQTLSSFSHGQTCSCQCQSFPRKNQGQTFINKSLSHCGAQHCLHINSCKSLNSSSNSSCSQNTLQFNIENVCTLSQNTYSNLGGGFIPENEETSGDRVDIPQLSGQNDSDLPSTTSSNVGSSANTSSSMSEKEVESILQIRKSATEILMASSRLLYKKSVKKTSETSERQTRVTPVEMPFENEPKQKRAWNRNRGSTTSTETSEDGKNVNRKCPFYKKIPDTCMTVDAFRYGNIPDCKAYILSHFHYDHYMGLTKQFKNPIYCSKITGNLVRKKIGMDSQYVNTIPLNTPTMVENVEITFLEANHCPGAVLILFKLKSGKVFLHTGDFRASQDMENYPPLQNIRIHSLYLDTTYCDPQYDFPSQGEVITFTVQLVLDALANNPKTLIVCGTYTNGKERIFTAIAEELDCKICVMRDKKNVLDCMEDEKLKRRISLNWEDSGLHVVPMNKINYNGLREHLLLNGKKYNSVLGIEPTGWTHNKKLLSLHHLRPKVNKDNIKIYGVPYSEHSSFLELKRFVQFTRPVKILPTVNNGNVHSRRKMEVIFEAWMEDVHTMKPSTSKQSSISSWAK